jgi:uncharacterized membrane protein
MLYLLLILIGVSAGLRSVTPLAAVSVGAWLGWIDLSATWASFVANPITVGILVLLALLELVGDQLPKTPSRKAPAQFGARVLAGALAGLLLGLPSGDWIAGLVLGAVGAVAGTFGGYEARRWLAARLGRDLPAAMIEDVAAIILAFAVVYAA